MLTSLTLLSLNNQVIGQLSEDEPRFDARYHIQSGTNQGYLIVKAQLPAGCYIYGIYQPEDRPGSLIEIAQSKQFRMLDKFKADKTPKVIEKAPPFEARIEKHYEVVQFYVPIELGVNVNPSEIKPVVRFTGQMCSDQGFCIPIHGKIMAAKFMGFFERREANKSDPVAKQRR